MSEPNTNPDGVSEHGTPVKTFTQEEVDALIGKRLAKAMKGIPSEEELTAYRTWKDSQQTVQQRQAQRNKDFDKVQSDLTAAQRELEQLRREKYVLSKGVSGEEAEFIVFKASKLVDDKTTFEKAVDSLTENRSKTKFDWSAPVGGGNSENKTNVAMNSIIRNAIK